MAAVEIILGDVVGENRLGLAKLVDEDGLGIGAVDTVHRIINHREVIALKESLDGVEVKDSLQESYMGLSGRNDINNDRAAAIVRRNLGRANLGNVNIGHVHADLVAIDGTSVGMSGLHQVLRGRSSILGIVFDSEVLLCVASKSDCECLHEIAIYPLELTRPTRVVTRREDECTEGLLPDRAALADDGRYGRS